MKTEKNQPWQVVLFAVSGIIVFFLLVEGIKLLLEALTSL